MVVLMGTFEPKIFNDPVLNGTLDILAVLSFLWPKVLLKTKIFSLGEELLPTFGAVA